MSESSASKRRKARDIVRNKTPAETLLDLFRKEIEIGRELVAAVPDAYPIGSVVYWQHGHYMRSGEVVAHNDHSPSVAVVGATGERYWVDAVKLVSAQFGSDAIYVRPPSRNESTTR